MTPKLDLVALKSQSESIMREETNLAVFMSECTQSTAFLLFALNYLQRVSGGYGMPDELEIKLDLGPSRPSTWRYRSVVGKSLLRFVNANGRWILQSSSATVTYRFTSLTAVLELVLSKFGLAGTQVFDSVVKAFSSAGDNDFEDLLAVFDIMPTNSVQALLVDQSKFARALGLSDLDGYARVVTHWFMVNIMAKGGGMNISSVVAEMAVEQGIHADEKAFIAHMKVVFDCRFDIALFSYADLYFLKPALDAGLILLDDFQNRAEHHIAQRSPAYIRKLIEVGVDFRKVKAIETLFDRAGILPNAKKDLLSIELLGILVEAGCQIPPRSSRFRQDSEYPLSATMLNAVAEHRKSLRKKRICQHD
jgi:hypothetical protein